MTTKKAELGDARRKEPPGGQKEPPGGKLGAGVPRGERQGTSRRARETSGRAEGELGDPRTAERFLTSTGVEISLRRISPFLRDKVRASVVWPERPTYQVQTVSGDVEEHPHDESTLESEEDRAAWADYQVGLAAANAEEAAKMVNLLFGRGVDYEALELPEDESWIAQQQELGVEVPEEPLKRKRHYLETELLADEDEIKRLTLRLMAMSGAEEEVIALAEKSFRGEVEGTDAREPEDLEGTVELRDELPEGPGSEGVGQES